MRPAKPLTVVLICGALVGCARQAPQSHSQGSSGQQTGASAGNQTTSGVPRAHPQAVEPVAGAGASATPPPANTQASVSVGPPSPSLPEPVSVTQVRQELSQSGMTASANQATLTADGLAIAPVDAPPAVREIIAAGNAIAHLPYHWGGGHATYEDTGYDCSGSLSYVFQAAHLLSGSVTSGELENWGAAGPGKWITVFANAGHTFMYVAGLRFDTVALAETGSRWSDRRPDENVSAFSIRHPPGL